MGVPVKVCRYGSAPALLQEGRIVCSQAWWLFWFRSLLTESVNRRSVIPDQTGFRSLIIAPPPAWPQRLTCCLLRLRSSSRSGFGVYSIP